VLRDLVEILPRLESTVHVSPTKLRHTAERLIGRDEDLSALDAAWNGPHKNVVVVRAFGGMGKTSLVATWMAELALKNWRCARLRLVVLQPGHARAECRIGGHLYGRGAAGLR